MAEPPPAPTTAAYAEVATGGSRAAKLDGVIVALGGSSITAVTAPEFTVTDAMATNLVVGNFLYSYPSPAIGQPLVSLTGVLAIKGMASKLEPRTVPSLSITRLPFAF